MLNRKRLDITLAKSYLTNIRWRWVLALGVAVNMATTFTIGIVIAIYAMGLAAMGGGEPDVSSIEQFAEQVGVIGAPLLSIWFLIYGVLWMGRKAGRFAVQNGLWVGGTAALMGQVLGWLFGATALTWLDFFWFLLLLAVGWLGGYLGQITFVEQEALSHASRAISQANSPQAIVRAIYEELAGAEISHLGLWHVHVEGEESHPSTLELLTACPAQSPVTLSSLLPLVSPSTLARLQPQAPLLLLAKDLPPYESVTWEKIGLRSVLLLPLTTANGLWVGVLSVASSRASLARRTEQAYLTISRQVTLALENWRLMEQAKQTGVLQERQRLAHEIHDTIAQGLISIVTHLEAAEQALPKAEQPILRHHFEHARRTARESLTQARRVVNDLRPQALEEAPFLEAIRRLVTAWSSQSGIAADLHITGDSQRLHPQIEITLLRVTQEALANVQKHAQASQVHVSLSYMDEMIALDVQDDGIGFNHPASERAPSSGGFGLTAMRERVEQWQGSLLLESAPGEGTTLVIQVPIFETR